MYIFIILGVLSTVLLTVGIAYVVITHHLVTRKQCIICLLRLVLPELVQLKASSALEVQPL